MNTLCDSCRAESDAWVDHPYRWRQFSADNRRRYDRMQPVVEDYYDLVKRQLAGIRERCIRLHMARGGDGKEPDKPINDTPHPSPPPMKPITPPKDPK